MAYLPARYDMSPSITAEEREDVLVSLWDNPSSPASPDDLEPLPLATSKPKFSLSFTFSTRWNQSYEGFENLFIQALLQAQHETTQVDEQMSRGVVVDMERLSDTLARYSMMILCPLVFKCSVLYFTVSLIKSYREMSTFKRVPKPESQTISKRLAVALYEPRYWYDSDSSSLVNLQNHVTRGMAGFLGKGLQQKLPTIFLDHIGRERRESGKTDNKNERRYSSESP